MNIPQIIAKELEIKKEQVDAVIKLFQEDATIPFIARYRKEHTGGLDEDFLRQIEDRLNYLTLLEDRRETILKSIDEQGKLTDELKKKILECEKLQELEDLYLPYKPKRKTRGTTAKAKGLEPLALFILENPGFSGNFEEKLGEFINEELGVTSIEDALQGAKDIIAEMISDNADVRKVVRETILENSVVKSEKMKDRKKGEKISEKQKEKDKKERFAREVTALLKAFSLAVPHDKAMKIKEEVGFFQVMKSKMLKITLGKARETVPAREKALRKAKLNIIRIKRGSGSFEGASSEPHSIPFKVSGKCGSCNIILMPAPQGTA